MIRPVDYMSDIEVRCPSSPVFRASPWLISRLTDVVQVKVWCRRSGFLSPSFFPLPSEFAETGHIYYDAVG